MSQKAAPWRGKRWRSIGSGFWPRKYISAISRSRRTATIGHAGWFGQTAMSGRARLRSNAAFCSYPTEELQSGHFSSQSAVRAGEPMGDPAFGTQLHEKPPEDQLDSWKEIAAYLGRDVTTVQRWEKSEAMPVHRHVHHKNSSVYALTSELDAWRKSSRPRLENENRVQASLPLPIEDGRTSFALQARWLGVAALGVLAVIAVAYIGL